MTDPRPRDLIGYGGTRPQAAWPGNARVAVSFVLNYEEGGERSVADGDPHAETYLTPEIVGLAPKPGRNLSVEDHFEYGTALVHGCPGSLTLVGQACSCHAVQAQRRAPPPHSAGAPPSHELAGLRGGTAPTGWPDALGGRGGA